MIVWLVFDAVKEKAVRGKEVQVRVTARLCVALKIVLLLTRYLGNKRIFQWHARDDGPVQAHDTDIHRRIGGEHL